MEIVFGAVTTSLLGYILSEVRELRLEINSLENRIIKMEAKIPKRKEDNAIDFP